ncbi:MAG TPA: Fic family protein [Elusimicrobiales bacterium]|nr:Fic family protein [Elusimicrobiales bacterium]
MPFDPKFVPTHHLLKVIEEAAELKSRIQSASIGVSWMPDMQREALARQTHGSTGIEGNPLTLPEIKTLAAGGTLPGAKPRAVQEILNYFEVLRYIGKHSHIKTIKVPQVLKLHAMMGKKNALDRGPVGAFRDYQVFVGRHTPPAPASVPYLVEELCGWLNGPGRQWPALVSSAILHYQFEHIHPFGDGNGRVGRALATWELYRKQFDTSHIFAVDEVFLEDRQAYYRALDRVPKQGGDVSGWVEYSSEAVLEALGRTWKRIDSIRAISGGKRIALTKNQERLLALLKEAPRGIQEIMSALKVTKPGAHFVLKPLLDAGLVKRTGGHKTGKYSI